MRRVKVFVFVALMLLTASTISLAADVVVAGQTDWTKAIFVMASVLGAGLCMGLGTLGTGLGMGRATAGSSEATARNPEAHGKIMLTMMVGLAMTESIAIYALVIALCILFANPFKAIILG